MEEEELELQDENDLSNIDEDVEEDSSAIDLLEDEIKDDLELEDEEGGLNELEMLMDPYELNDY